MAKTSTRNTSAKILECFVLLCALLAVTTQGRSVHRIPKHGVNGGAKSLVDLENESNFDEYNDYDSSMGIQVFSPSRRHSRREEASDIFDVEVDVDEMGESSENEEEVEVARRPRHWRNLPLSRRRSHAMKKRHNGAGDDVAYATMSEIDEAAYLKSRARSIHHRGSLDTVRNKRYEVEIKEAQNSSICNYTVVDIPDPSIDSSRVPKNLVNVMCNHAGSRCRDTGSYCCIQTYSKIDVSYGNGDTETLKIYTGCVCSLRFYGELKPYKPRLAIDD